MDLSAYATKAEVAAGYVAKEEGKGLSTNDLTDELKAAYDAAAEAAENGAEANVLESVAIAGTPLTIENKGVSIPVATGSLLGVVKGATAINTVAIDTDGTMKLNQVNVQNLVVVEGDELILDCGAAQ